MNKAAGSGVILTFVHKTRQEARQFVEEIFRCLTVGDKVKIDSGNGKTRFLH
jgi:hypothetical protein